MIWKSFLLGCWEATMKRNKILTVFHKEFRDTFRDKSTIFSVLVLPLVIFPAIFISMGLLIGQQTKKEERRISQVSIAGGYCDSILLATLKADPKIVLAELPDPVKELEKGAIQAVLQFNGEKSDDNRCPAITVLYLESNRNSLVAQKRIKQVIEVYHQKNVRDRLIRHGIDTMLLRSSPVSYKNVASAKSMGGFLMGMIIPYMIVMLICVGAIHTAMDITAGEKERKTIETLLVANISRNQIVAGKLLTAIAMGLITAFSGLLSLGLTALSGISLFSARTTQTNLSFSPGALVFSFLAIIPTAVLLSALLLLIGSFARTVKEGAAYGSYFLMAVLMLAMGSMTPMDPSPKMFAIPVLNTALCQKELLMGILNWAHIGMAILTTSLLAVIAAGITVGLFSQERVLFRS
jgi:sodium transport system permease protein